MIAGTAYGVILNDREQLASLAEAFHRPPYKSPPVAPVLYIKPRNCFALGGCAVSIPPILERVEIAPTVAVLFGRDLTRGNAEEAEQAIAAAALALDVSEPHAEFYRPAIRQRCRDGFLPLGCFGAARALDAIEIVTRVNDEEVHRWALDRLVRPVTALAAKLSGFMTLAAGDILLVGLPGDAPSAAAGDTIEVLAEGLPTLGTKLVTETVS